MNSNRKLARGALLAVLLTLSACPPAWASSVTLVVGCVEAKPGARVVVSVEVRAAQQLGALQMDLLYDPAILEAQGVEKGALPQDIAVAHKVVSPGRLRVVMNASARESINGNGVLLKALFTVKGSPGQQSELKLEATEAWDNTKPDAPPYEMQVTVEHGKLTVVDRAAPEN